MTFGTYCDLWDKGPNVFGRVRFFFCRILVQEEEDREGKGEKREMFRERERKREWWNRREGDRLKVVAINQMKSGDKFCLKN